MRSLSGPRREVVRSERLRRSLERLRTLYGDIDRPRSEEEVAAAARVCLGPLQERQHELHLRIRDVGESLHAPGAGDREDAAA